MCKKRRFFCIALCALVVFYPSAISSAATFDDGLHVPISDRWVKEPLDSKGLVYHGRSVDGQLEFSLLTSRTLKSNLSNTWAGLSDEELKAKAKDVVKKGADNIIFDDNRILHTPQMKFIVFDGTIIDGEEGSDKKTYFTQYTTIVNGGTLQFSFFRSDHPLDENDQSIAESIVKDAYYDKITTKAIDGKIAFYLAAAAVVVILLILSVIWNIRRYRKKIAGEKK